MPAIFHRPGFKSRRLYSLHLFLLLMLSLIEMNVIGQNAEQNTPACLRLNEVNSHAARHFLSHFPLTSAVTWTRDDHYYVACFHSENTRTRVHYKSNGNFAFCLKYYREDALNGTLKSAIFKKFPGCQIMAITELTDDLYKHAFFVNIKYGSYIETLRCDDEGIEISENIKDAGV